MERFTLDPKDDSETELYKHIGEKEALVSYLPDDHRE
jgi:hypothetical protein